MRLLLILSMLFVSGCEELKRQDDRPPRKKQVDDDPIPWIQPDGSIIWL
jgi:hypothetical protein